MKTVNPKLKSKTLPVLLLNEIANQDPSEVRFICNVKTIERLRQYSDKVATIPPLWNENYKLFIGVPVVGSFEVQDNIIAISTGSSIFWPEDK